MQQLVYTITQAANVACMTESQVKKMCKEKNIPIKGCKLSAKAFEDAVNAEY
jgi:hypothetical protein